MTKRIFTIITIITLLAASLLPVNAADYTLGDVDGVGGITAADARLALRASVNLEKLSGNTFKAADADNNGSITAADARLILRASVGLEELDTSTPAERGYYKAGEIWKVDNNFEFTITRSRTHELCNQFSNKEHNLTDEQVVIITYSYKNTGYNNGEYELYMDIFNVYDETGEKAILYACTHYRSPSSLIVGTNCTGEVAFALKNKSKTITVELDEYTDSGKCEATYKINVNESKSAPSYKLEIPSAQLDKMPGIGEKWTEPGKCEITITDIDVHHLCNDYSNRQNGYTNQQVVNITYTVKNLGINKDMYVSLYDVYDEKGTAGELYACTHTDYSGSCGIGESVTGSESFVLDNNSDFVLLEVEYNDTEYKEYNNVFKIDIR